MDLQIKYIVESKAGKAVSKIESFSHDGVSEVELRTVSGNNSASIRLSDENGKMTMAVDPEIIRILAESMSLNLARLIIDAGILTGNIGDLKIDCDRSMSILAKQNMTIGGALALSIGAKASSIKIIELLSIASKLFNLIADSSINMKAPLINLKGLVNLGENNLRKIALDGDTVMIPGVKTGDSAVTGRIIATGSSKSS